MTGAHGRQRAHLMCGSICLLSFRRVIQCKTNKCFWLIGCVIMLITYCKSSASIIITSKSSVTSSLSCIVAPSRVIKRNDVRGAHGRAARALARTYAHPPPAPPPQAWAKRAEPKPVRSRTLGPWVALGGWGGGTKFSDFSDSRPMWV